MRKRWLALILMIVLFTVAAACSEGSLAMSISPTKLSPGDLLHIYFSSPKEGIVSLVVVDAAGKVCASLIEEEKIAPGANALVWGGTENGQVLAPGAYVLRLTLEDMSVEMDITILPGKEASASGASLSASEEDAPEEELVIQPAAASEAAITPAFKSAHAPNPAHEACYWCTPMDITDAAAVWAMLTAPITVVKPTRDKEPQKEQVILREEPNEDSKGIGVVTCVSQSVHVLENRSDGWSLVECYSSSFHDSRVKAWNLFVTGYIKTNRLTEKTPSQDYGIVVDKLTQELYLFKEGRLFSTLRVSTGLYNDKQPYNETRSGEFLLVSKTGDIRSDNTIGSMALRFNSGDLVHEVPHVLNADGTKNFGYTEPKLGTRASHGCIRVQRLKNAEGVNMAWIRNNVPLNTKFVIWEDYSGRFIGFPDPSTPLYYNANGGSNYHSTDNCPGVRDEYLPLTGTLIYSQLDEGSYQKLTPCANCVPPRRGAEIEEINKIHETESPGEVPQHLKQED